MDVAIQLTDACVWAYNSTTSGVGPEIFSYVPCGKIDDSQTGEKCAYSEEKWHDAMREYWRPTNPNSKTSESDLKVAQERVLSIIKSERLPPGFVDMKDPKYILRPEAIEVSSSSTALPETKLGRRKAGRCFSMWKSTHGQASPLRA